MQGSVLSAFFWGYLFTQVLGGYLSALVGGKIVIGTAVLASAVLTLMSPVAATTHVYIFIAIRAALGVVQVRWNNCRISSFVAPSLPKPPPVKCSLCVEI